MRDTGIAGAIRIAWANRTGARQVTLHQDATSGYANGTALLSLKATSPTS
jgi:hypothetical protein